MRGGERDYTYSPNLDVVTTTTLPGFTRITNEYQRTLQKENKKPFSGSKKLKLNALSFQPKKEACVAA